MIKRIVVFALTLASTSALSSAATDAQTGGTVSGAVNGIKGQTITNAKVLTRVAVCSETTKFSGGTVTANRTLTKACSPYTINTDISVNGNATLTIAPGVTVRFDPDTSLSIGDATAAKLVAVGTATDPIVLTSSSGTPGAGNWTGVRLLSHTINGTKFGYLKLEYCGGSDACLFSSGVKANRVVVDHATFAHVNTGSDAILQKDADSNFAISNCTFNDVPVTPTQQYAISVNAQSFAGIDSTNTFNGSRVEVRGGAIYGTVAWTNIGTAVVVTDDIQVDGAPVPSLTIAAGSSFQFAPDTGIVVGYAKGGKLVLTGTATSMVTLASAAAFNPGPGDWSGIRVCANGQATINSTRISYGGSSLPSGASGDIVVEDGARLTISNSILSKSSGYGLWLRSGSTATVNADTTVQYENNASGTIGPGPS